MLVAFALYNVFAVILISRRQGKIRYTLHVCKHNLYSALAFTNVIRAYHTSQQVEIYSYLFSVRVTYIVMYIIHIIGA